jgi:AcrR family transcriptional regulator
MPPLAAKSKAADQAARQSGLRAPHRKSAARRQAILAVAEDQFLARGYAGASMAEIAAALGGSKGTLYHHFNRKADVLRAVVARRIAALREALAGVDLPQDSPPATRLVETAIRFLTVLTAPETLDFLRLMIAEGERFPDLARAVREMTDAAVTARVVEMIAAMSWEGALRRIDPQAAAQVFLGLAVEGPLLRRLFGEARPPQRLDLLRHLAPAIEAFLNAYAPDPSETVRVRVA